MQRQRADPRSALSLYRALLRLRRSEPALSLGAYITVRHNDAVLVYERRYEGRWLQIMLNMTGQVQPIPIEEPIDKIVLSTWLDDAACRGALQLRPNEGLILEAKR